MKIKEIMYIPILFIVLFLLVIIAPYHDSFTVGEEIYINEVMAANKSTYMAKNGKYYDYIELYNNTDEDIDLEGYYLSDSNGNTRKYKMPKVSIKAKDYLTVFASGLDKFVDGEVHTNFKISSHGEMLILSDNKGSVIGKINVNSTMEDTSYGYNGEKYVYYYTGTPNAKNTGSTSDTPIKKASSNESIKINEYILDNTSMIKNKENKYYNMLELLNETDKDINLEGYYLSDDSKALDKYKLPDVTIKAKSYLVLYLNSDAKVDGETHIKYNIENNGGELFLSDSNKKVIDKVKLEKLAKNITCGKYDNLWHLYKESSFGEANKNNYMAEGEKSSIIINEVTSKNPAAIEVKNISTAEINLGDYSIGDKSGKIYKFPNVKIAAGGYYKVESSAFKFGISNTKEKIFLYKNNIVEDTFEVGKLRVGLSAGLNDKGERVYYSTPTLGRANTGNYYLGYASEPVFSTNTTYVSSGTKIEIKSIDGATIRYTTDGSTPTSNSAEYKGPITVSSNAVIKAVAFKKDYLQSDVVSRTFLTGRKHKIAVVSMSAPNASFYGSNGLFTKYKQVLYKQVDVEFYENDGTYGTSFPGEVKLSGNIGGSRDKSQKAMTVYLRKNYGTNTVTYPFFKDSKSNDYSSILFRNGGEDYLNVHIFDAALQMLLKGQMDIDMQDYRPVAMYINGSYYGISNMRDKLNSDYAVNQFDADKNTLSVIKYSTATKGISQGFRNLYNYIKSHDCSRKDVYEYLKTQIDMQEVVNYWIVQSFYGNTDLGNIKYWKDEKGKWRFMLYDIDWSLYYSSKPYNYPVASVKVPAATYSAMTVEMVRSLYKNAEFRALYLSSFGKYLKSTFTPDRFNKIVDELAKEIEEEVPYHTQRWNGTNSSLGSVSSWKNHVEQFKNKYKARYNYVKSSIRTNFSMSNAEYSKYFG